MKKLVFILFSIMMYSVFSKTEIEFLNDFDVSKESVEFYSKALDLENMNGSVNEVKSIYNKSFDLDNKNYLALNKLGEIARVEGKTREAEKLYLQSLEINLNAYETYNLLIALYKETNDLIKLKEIAYKLTEIHSDYPEGYYILAQLFEKEGDNNNALKYYESALEKYKTYNIKKFPEQTKIVIENRKFDSIIGISNIHLERFEYKKALDILLTIDPISSSYSDIERQNYTNVVIDSLKKLNKFDSKSAKNYLKLFQKRLVLPKNFKI